MDPEKAKVARSQNDKENGSEKTSTGDNLIDEAFRLMDSGFQNYFQRTLKELTDIKEAIDKVLSVAITDSSGVITYVNDRFCQLYKYSKEEVVGNTHRLLKSGEHPEEFYKKLWTTISSGKIFEGEVKNRAKDGSFHWAYMVIVPFLQNGGRPYQYVSFRTDITAIKDAEIEKMKLLKAEAVAASAESAVQARDRFVSMAAHELKTPITSLQMILDLLVRQVQTHDNRLGSAQVGQLLNTASFQTRRLTSIINDLLDVSRIAAGKLKLNCEVVDLGALINELVIHSQADFHAAGCEVNVDIQDSIQGVWDRDRLAQVLINLLSNAMKYGQRKPIKIVAGKDGQVVTLKVIDQGIGIPKDFQESLFKRFERADTAEHFKGIGLGLWITRQIVEAHGGSISAESEMGHGAIFVVRLPCTRIHV